MPQKSLFRERAVNKMLSPDELDRLMRVTDPKGWLALMALLAVVVPAVVWGVFGSIPTQVSADHGILLNRDALHGVVSQTSGIVTEVTVTAGDDVREGQILARVRTEAGAEATVISLFGGTVIDVPIDRGMFLNRGQQVAVVEEGNEPLEAIFFVPAEEGKQLAKGMQVHVSPSTAKAEEFGNLQGTISSVSELPVTQGDLLKRLRNQSLVDALRSEKAQLEVIVELLADPSTPTGFQWSSSRGPVHPLAHATLCTGTFVLGQQRPLDLLRPDGTNA